MTELFKLTEEEMGALAFGFSAWQASIRLQRDGDALRVCDHDAAEVGAVSRPLSSASAEALLARDLFYVKSATETKPEGFGITEKGRDTLFALFFAPPVPVGVPEGVA